MTQNMTKQTFCTIFSDFILKLKAPGVTYRYLQYMRYRAAFGEKKHTMFTKIIFILNICVIPAVSAPENELQKSTIATDTV